MQKLIQQVIQVGGSGLYLSAGESPWIRVCKNLIKTEEKPIDHKAIQELFYPLLSSQQIVVLEKERRLTVVLGLANHRCRTHLFWQKKTLAAIIRLIPQQIPTLSELGFAQAICDKILSLKWGLIIVTGGAVSGKSTTVAAIINHIQQNKSKYILTIEDPIEFVYPEGKSLICQLSIKDEEGIGKKLNHLSRHNPDVLYVSKLTTGEDYTKLLEAAYNCLVILEMDKKNTYDVVDNIDYVFCPDEACSRREQFAKVMELVCAQQLVPGINNELVLACELVVNTPALSNIICDDHSHMIHNTIITGQKYGMKSMDGVLAELVANKKISEKTAILYSHREKDVICEYLKRQEEG